jgi:hypothetical protein
MSASQAWFLFCFWFLPPVEIALVLGIPLYSLVSASGLVFLSWGRYSSYKD